MRSLAVDVFTHRPFLHMLPMFALLTLVIASSWFVYPRTILRSTEPVMSRADLTLAAVPTAPSVRPRISTNSIGVRAGAEQGPLATESSVQSTFGVVQPRATESPEEGALLPKHRILLIYGLPGDERHGMLASYDNLRLLEILESKCEEFEKLDPDRPVILGLQLIASAAQKRPGADGSYLRDTSVTTIYEYITFTRDHEMLLFLDAQIGRRSVPDDVQRLSHYLQQPHVHLGIDPEFDVERTEIPMQDVGSTSAAEIRWVQEFLVKLSRDANIPPKILIVHQFTEEMIMNRSLLLPVRGVQLVLNVSLWGTIAEKSAAWQALVADDPVQFGGIMISSTWDDPAMSTEDVINLPHAPEIVIYQ